MTIELLNKIFKEHNIPSDAKVMSDSGWECDATEMDGVYYNPKTNTVVFTQDGSVHDSYFKDFDWKILYRSLRILAEDIDYVANGIYDSDDIELAMKRRKEELYIYDTQNNR